MREVFFEEEHVLFGHLGDDLILAGGFTLASRREIFASSSFSRLGDATRMPWSKTPYGRSSQ